MVLRPMPMLLGIGVAIVILVVHSFWNEVDVNVALVTRLIVVFLYLLSFGVAVWMFDSSEKAKAKGEPDRRASGLRSFAMGLVAPVVLGFGAYLSMAGTILALALVALAGMFVQSALPWSTSFLYPIVGILTVVYVIGLLIVLYIQVESLGEQVSGRSTYGPSWRESFWGGLIAPRSVFYLGVEIWKCL